LLLLVLILLQPFGDALQMQRMPTSTPYNRTIVPRILPIRWTAVKRVATDAAHVIASVPAPVGNGMPSLDGDFECHRSG
jgi:hypothetical protein